MVLLKRSAYEMYVARHHDPTITGLLSQSQVSHSLEVNPSFEVFSPRAGFGVGVWICALTRVCVRT